MDNKPNEDSKPHRESNYKSAGRRAMPGRVQGAAIHAQILPLPSMRGELQDKQDYYAPGAALSPPAPSSGATCRQRAKDPDRK